MHPIARTEESPAYLPTLNVEPVDPNWVRAAEDRTIEAALEILGRRLGDRSQVFESPNDVKAFCRLKLGGLEHEEFAVLFLDAQHRLIKFESMFRGTVSQTSVYPREIVKAALKLNASAIIMTHNHPSGRAEPSRADEHLTNMLKQALNVVDVRVLDHIVVSATETKSFAELGLL